MNRKFYLVLIFISFISIKNYSKDINIQSRTLKNGLKVIVCKTDNNFVGFELCYKVGSKDEKPGIRGIAHLVEHMMFRGTKKYPNDKVWAIFDKMGAFTNAFTNLDQTVYMHLIPKSSLDLAFDIESDRMNNLVIDDNLVKTEREIVGEEFRLYENNWFEKLNYDIYHNIYPDQHPYEGQVIGNLPDILNADAEKCNAFYQKFYTPDNSFLVITGNVDADSIFALSEKYFGKIEKKYIKDQLPYTDIKDFKIKKDELFIKFPVQIYSYNIATVDATNKDFFTLRMLTDILFTNKNSILRNRLLKKDHSVYEIVETSENFTCLPKILTLNVIMGAAPGNVKVKKVIREELNKVIENGISKEMIDNYIKSEESKDILNTYSSLYIAGNIVNSEYFFGDYNKAFKFVDEYKKITNDDIKRIAKEYFFEDKIQIINIKPLEQ